MIILTANMALFAQVDGLPANPDPGKCYVKCVTHDEFRTETVQVKVQDEYKVLKVIPATYKWVEEKVMIKEPSVKYIYHPAQYEWKEVSYIKKEPETVLSVVPARLGQETETIEVYPETGAWEYTSYAECKSPNPDDCKTLCYVTKPAQYVYIPTKPLIEDARTTETTKPAVSGTYKVQVVTKKAWVEEVEIPAQYSTIKRQVIDRPARVEEKVIPAKYETVTKQILVKKGGVTTWEEIDCGLVKPNKLNILWDYNSATLRPEAKAEIDRVLLPLLKENPNVTIELSSHTDSRGSAEFNRALSQRRADAVKNYLVSKGIPASRIVSKGYGESRLVNNCSDGVPCTEQQHQENRRTEYRIINSK